MNILVLGSEHIVTQKLLQELFKRHSITTVAELPDVTVLPPGIHHLKENPGQNGLWMKSLPQELGCIIDATFPERKASRTFHLQKEEERLLHRTKNLIEISKKHNAQYLQLLPITMYASNARQPINVDHATDSSAVGWGQSYLKSMKLLQSQVPQFKKIIFGQLLYNSEGGLYSADFPRVANVYVPINESYNVVTTTHEADLIKGVVDMVENKIQLNSVVLTSPEKLSQREILSIFAQKNNTSVAPIAVPSQLARVLWGIAADTWSKGYVPPSRQSEETMRYLSFPTLKSGLGLP